MKAFVHSFYLYSFQCNLLYIQKTPDICEFLGLAKPTTTTTTPSTTSPVTTTATTATTKSPSKPATESNKKPSTNNDDTDNHSTEGTGSIGSEFIFARDLKGNLYNNLFVYFPFP